MQILLRIMYNTRPYGTYAGTAILATLISDYLIGQNLVLIIYNQCRGHKLKLWYPRIFEIELKRAVHVLWRQHASVIHSPSDATITRISSRKRRAMKITTMSRITRPSRRLDMGLHSM
jgi:hypothetical protein